MSDKPVSYQTLLRRAKTYIEANDAARPLYTRAARFLQTAFTQLSGQPFAFVHPQTVLGSEAQSEARGFSLETFEREATWVQVPVASEALGEHFRLQLSLAWLAERPSLWEALQDGIAAPGLQGEAEVAPVTLFVDSEGEPTGMGFEASSSSQSTGRGHAFACDHTRVWVQEGDGPVQLFGLGVADLGLVLCLA